MNFQAIQPIMANMQGIERLQNIQQAGSPNRVNQPSDDRLAFESILGAYMDMVGAAGRAEANAERLAVEFALGNHDDMLSVIIAQEMAYTSINFATQVTSRIIEAYREIMRMQI
ncbi:MAG: flagellar hook-basal body complex protein FliE [Defluviitaleaceae bacterium]|nr:flagellar hook-basal body complex protein FliE [Defluviitaleaceae bacterium]